MVNKICTQEIGGLLGKLFKKANISDCIHRYKGKNKISHFGVWCMWDNPLLGFSLQGLLVWVEQTGFRI